MDCLFANWTNVLPHRVSSAGFLLLLLVLFFIFIFYLKQTLLASIIASVWPYLVVPSAVHSPFCALPRSGFVVSNSFHAMCIVCYARHSLICASSLQILRFNIKDMGSVKSRETISPSIILSSFVSWPFFLHVHFLLKALVDWYDGWAAKNGCQWCCRDGWWLCDLAFLYVEQMDYGASWRS